MEKTQLRVGIGDCKTSESPNSIITVGLGSCVGVTMYDKSKKIGGLAHVMLPDSTQFSKVTNKFKFANLAIESMLEELLNKGAIKQNIEAKVAGGASMFNFSDKKMIMDIGERNCKAVKSKLEELKIRVISEELRGNKGRSMTFNLEDGTVSIKTVGEGTKVV